nr:non-ribosomal peptide synthetase [Paenibacillus lutrae]
MLDELLRDRSAAAYPANITLHELFEEQATKRPDCIAVVCGDDSLTYGELSKRAKRTAFELRARGVGPDTIVGLMMERSVDMVIGILAILQAGGAYMPIDPEYPEDRIRYMLEDSGATLVVTDGANAGRIPLTTGSVITVGRAGESEEEQLPENSSGYLQGTQSHHLAYVLYTSGTTGRPKGVMIEHRNVVQLLFHEGFPFDFNENDTWTLFHSCSFDFSVWELFGALLYGGKLVVVDKETTRDPVAFASLLRREKVTVLNQTPTAFYQLLNVEAGLAADLPVRVVIFGGEALTPARIRAWYDAYPQVKLVNMYGITETTVHVTYKELNAEDFQREASPIGRTLGPLQAYVLDAQRRLQPVGVTGELHIGGAGLARGYLNRPDLTAERFVPNPFVPGERLYKTGDLARMLPDRTLEYGGRADYQVKIRGHRIELGEIEARLLAIPGIREAAVLAWDGGSGQQELCAYLVASEAVTASSVRKNLSLTLPAFMLPSQVVMLDGLPLTVNGKLDRAKLPRPERGTSRGEGATPPRNEWEAQLAALWEELLDVEAIGMEDDFFELGGHSLKATQLAAQMRQRWGIEMPLQQIFATPTVADMSAYVMQAERSQRPVIERAEPQAEYPVSSAQKRMYLLDQRGETGTSYNIPILLRLEGDLDERRFAEAFHRLTQRHESLRTSFHLVNGEPVQRIHDHVVADLVFTDEPDAGEGNLLERCNLPFDLAKAPLLRAGVVRTAPSSYLFYLNIHHIVADGSSLGVLIDEFAALYEGRALPEPLLQYKDFAVWQNRMIESGALARQEAFWLDAVSDDIPVLQLPTDFPRPPVQTFEGDHYEFAVSPETTDRLRRLAKEEGTTLYMILLAAYARLLAVYGEQDDLVIGSGVAGRNQAELQAMIGMFVNMLLMCVKIQEEQTFRTLIRQVKATSLQAFEHQDYPFEMLVERSGIERDVSRNPLFDASFVVQNMDMPEIRLSGLRCTPCTYRNRTAKFDLTLFAWEQPDRLTFSLEYATALFRRSTVERMMGHFTQLVEEIARDADRVIGDVSLMTLEETHAVLTAWNDTDAPASESDRLHRLFEEQAERTPDRVALQWRDMSITYRELNEKANKLASYLVNEHGLKPDSPVGLLLEHPPDRVTAILAVLKAGGAFVPLDPNAPLERLKTIARDTAFPVLLTEKRHIRIANALQWECPALGTFVCLDSRHVLEEPESERNGLMNRELWEFIGREAENDIAGGGWTNSYTGDLLTREEMDEYASNVLEKLRPYLHSSTRVLEIGCASGITMFGMAPHVGLYVGTDLSDVIIEKNRARIHEEGHANIRLACIPAHHIDTLEEQSFDIIILNSVIQAFHGHNYLRQVLAKAVNLLSDRGLLFIGDVMDLASKEVLHRSLIAYKQEYPDAKAKTDLSAELFLSKAFFEDWAAATGSVSKLHFSRKRHTIENELTRFRYDVMAHIDKSTIAVCSSLEPCAAEHEKEDREEEHSREEHSEDQGKVRATAWKKQHGWDAVEPYTAHNVVTDVQPHHLAYIIYTSGTTGTPKGVMIEHRSIANTLHWRRQEYALGEHDRCLQLFSYVFDGYVTSLFTPLLAGSTAVLLDDETVKDPLAIRKAVGSYQITHLLCVPSLFRALLIGMDPDETASLRVVTLAGEAVSDELVASARVLGSGVELVNEYGPTENSVATTVLRRLERQPVITIGRPIVNTRVYVLDRNLRPVPVGVLGELCIAGIGLARGYWQRHEETQRQFTRLYAPGKEERLYRTGDLVRWLPDGTLEYRGRRDDQVKVRGYRIEPGEIETRLMEVPGVRQAVVVIREEAGDEREMSAFFTSEQLHVQELRSLLETMLPGYMIPSRIVRLEDMPLTVSGKPDRKALSRHRFEQSQLPPSALPRTKLEEDIASIWQDLLAIDRIGIHDNFFELGGHSLKASLLVARVQLQLGRALRLQDIFAHPTVEGLALAIETKDQIKQSPIELLPQQDSYPVSSVQRRQYVLSQIQGAEQSYHMPSAVLMTGVLQRERFEQAWRELVDRHESLRTSFVMEGGELRQRIADKVDFTIDELTGTWTADQAEQAAAAFVRPFELSEAPLLRVGLLRMNDSTHLLLVDLHHIIADGMSVNLLIEEFGRLYAGEKLPKLHIHYKDYVAWQQERLRSDALREQEAYWLGVLSGELPSLDLPADQPRPAVRSFTGETVAFTLDQACHERLQRLAAANGATLYMVLLALYTAFLSRVTGQEDMIVGTPVAGRSHSDVERMVGMFVNTLAIRTFPQFHKPLSDYVMEIKQIVLEALDHQEYPFDELVEKLDLPRDVSRNPVFDTMFVLQNIDRSIVSLPSLNLKTYPLPHRTAKFDLLLSAEETDEGIALVFEYAEALFRKDTIERWVTYFDAFIRHLVSSPGTAIGDAPLILHEENSLQTGYRDFTAAVLEPVPTIHRRFEAQVSRVPDHTAVVDRDNRITYRELNDRANRLAGRLNSKGVGKGAVVGILMPKSIDLAVGIMAILKAGAAYMPLVPDDPAERRSWMLSDSGAGMLLTVSALAMKLEPELAWPSSIICIEVEENEAVEAEAWRDAKHLETDEPMDEATEETTDQTEPDDPAYIIYTSGTTGRPKGIVTTHRNVVSMVPDAEYLGLDEQDALLGFSNPAFDAFVIDLFGALLNGAKTVLLSKEEMADLRRLPDLIQSERITTFFATTSLFNLLVDHAPGCFPGIRRVVFGGEIASAVHVNKALALSGPGTLFNIYGPTETTVAATYYPVVDAVSPSVPIPIGTPVTGATVLIVGTSGQLQPIGLPGELCIAGGGVSQGYLHRPDLTAATFVSHPSMPGTIMYRTGDRARWLADGTIEFLGRIDQQVKIRGNRIELAEIETSLLQLEGVREATVIVLETEAGKSLVAYYVADSELANSRLREHMTGELPAVMVPAHYIRLDRLPLSRNGKVDRSRLPSPAQQTDGDERPYDAPRNETEAAMAELWQQVLGEEKIGIRDNFFERGGHSLSAMTLISLLHQRLNLNVSLRMLFQHPTVESLSFAAGGASEAFQRIEPAQERASYPLTSAQKRLFVLDHLDAAGLSYNMPSALQVEGEVDPQRAKRAFHALVRRHEALRTSFDLEDGLPVQRIHPNIPADFEYDEVTEPEVEAYMGTFFRPFEIGQAPLMRSALLRVAERRFVLLIDMHHIISDGVSSMLLIRDWTRLYDGEVLEQPSITYKDYAVWQQSHLASETVRKQRAYWQDALAGDLGVLQLPSDYPRPPVQTFAGDSEAFTIDPATSARLRKLAKQEGATLFMVLLAVYTAWLGRLSAQEDIIVGTPAAGRPHADVQQTVGMFVNTLALRTKLSPEGSFADHVKNVKQVTLGALDHQDYPFEELVEALQVRRDVSRNPLFDVMFALHNMEKADWQSEAISLSPYPYRHTATKFDLTLNATEAEDGIHCILEYRTDLFQVETIRRWVDMLVRLASYVSELPDAPLVSIELVSEQERALLVHTFNETQVAYPQDATIHGLFEQQAAQNPDRIAVIAGDEQTTYAELNDRAERLAVALRQRGVRADSVVAVMTERSVGMLVGLLAVWKAGGGYLPIDPEYPLERIRFMLEDSGAAVLLTDRSGPAEVEAAYTLDLNDPQSWRVTGARALQQSAHVQASSLAYVIYTSGSTGMPKGVMIEHRSVVNRLLWMQRQYPLTAEDVILQKTTFSFDVSVWELFWWMLAGAKVCLLAPGEEKDPSAIASAIEAAGVTTLHFVPSMLQAFLDTLRMQPSLSAKLTGVRRVFASGEALASSHVRLFRELMPPRTAFVNLYGPTEATVDVSFHECVAEDAATVSGTVPIGRPIDNISLYVLDAYGHVSPIGVPGELCIAGAGLARGYLNRPEATAERFVPHPFADNERLYKTGDLARWLPCGRLEYMGRLDHQVKIRGYRIELGEIETGLLRVPGVHEAAVIVRSGSGGMPELCAYVVAPEIDVQHLRQALAQRLPHYMVPALFMRIERMPLTGSGKLDRKALPAPRPDIGSGEPGASPRNETERLLVSIWEDVLGAAPIGIEDNFFELGGDSIKALQVASQLFPHGFTLALKDVFRHPTVSMLSGLLEHHAPEADQSEVVGVTELSPVQRWFLEQRVNDEHHFNQSVMLFRQERFVPEAVQGVFQALTMHHDALRLVFPLHNGHRTAYHLGSEDMRLSLEIVNVTQEADPQSAIRKSELRLQSGIDLEQGPLIKLGLFRAQEGDHLLIVIHHLVMDGVSWRILLEDFAWGYRNWQERENRDPAFASLPFVSKPTELRFPMKTTSFRDYAEKLGAYANSYGLQQERSYWERQVGLLASPLPRDLAVTSNATGDARSVHIELSERTTAQLLREANKAYRTEINELLLSALAMTVRKWSGKERVWVTLEGHGREDMLQGQGVNVSRTIGWFTSLVPVLLEITSIEERVENLISNDIKAVKDGLRRLPNKGVGYGVLAYRAEESLRVPEIRPEISFNYLGQWDREMTNDVFAMSAVTPMSPISSRLERAHQLDLTALIKDGRFLCSIHYNGLAYREPTMRQFIDSYKQHLLSVIGHCMSKPESEATLSDYDDDELTTDALQDIAAIVNSL